MKIVADTSVIVGVISKQAVKKHIIKISTGYELYAPESVLWEVGNAISLMFKKKTVTFEEATLFLNDFRKIHIEYIPISFDDVIKLCYEENIYAYDAYVLQAAIEYRYPLLTFDKKQMTIAQALNINTITI